MTPSELREIPLTKPAFDGAPGLMSMGPSQQLNDLLLTAYSIGYILLQIDDNGRPVRAFRQCSCDLCVANRNATNDAP